MKNGYDGYEELLRRQKLPQTTRDSRHGSSNTCTKNDDGLEELHSVARAGGSTSFLLGGSAVGEHSWSEARAVQIDFEGDEADQAAKQIHCASIPQTDSN